MMKTKKMLCAVVMVMMLAIMFTVPAFCLLYTSDAADEL